METYGPFYWHGSTLIPTWISDYIHYKMWDEIAYTHPPPILLGMWLLIHVVIKIKPR